ncbi:undecaprenyl/decaprenyl-phosphate alpha-N-acetylglucosaminyl 1-phosphate transferase [Thermosipho ferrireducens]|uniref:Undecaprenyl/decaprenyl-phosphate alpha-N-acetylglucosaminyl 1-phosphate transferase n=1 Tax=Thermosipho ferrireducens TaxID=2571116 RepID=A0ABX7SAZ6_9BACT|nr:MraY family glycosyltransferase [Thermosipho ferrireducens]QTA38643.1 undecaprenyl/decaprenyl-phosphate alpha-N-acetylglucosaminyl 1-phosphate transferase [Thermosipho ferrireducens]
MLFIVLSFAVAVVSIPIAGKIARKYGIVDKPDGILKTHEKGVPYLGGMGIYFALMLISPFDIVVKSSITLLAFLGLYDDLKGVSPKIRLIIEFIAGGLLAYKYVGVSLYLFLGAFFVAVIINAVNMMDGMDGVCSGVSVIGSAGLIFIVTSNYDKQLLLALIGALVAYLMYNFPPARIFMGDMGSYIVGGVLSAAFLSSSRAGTVSLLSAVIILTPFFLDLAAGFFRRLLNGKSPFSGDRAHIYDKVYLRLKNKRKTFFIMLIISSTYVLTGFLFYINSSLRISAFLFYLVITIFLVLHLKLLKYE